MLKKLIAGACMPLLLAGCVMSSTMFGNGVTARSLLSPDANQLRNSFLIARLTGNPLRYRVPIACNYRLQYARTSEDRMRSGRGRITLNAHKGAIYSYVQLNNQESTGSMDDTGFVHQFNATLIDGQQLLGWQGTEAGTRPIAFENVPTPEILMFLPQYYPGPWTYGDTVATLYNGRRQPVGEYLYRGMVTDYGEISRQPGKRYAALDLLTGSNGQAFDRENARVIRGFAILDLETMLPVIFSYRPVTGGDLMLRQRKCD